MGRLRTCLGNPPNTCGARDQSPVRSVRRPWISDKLRQRIELTKVGQMCDNAISLLEVDLRMDALSNRTVEFDTVMAKFQRSNTLAQGDPASRPLLLVLGGRVLVCRRLRGW